jgi:thermitase
MVLKDAIDEAKAWNVVLVASAGNNSTSAVQYPAAYPGVMAVASTMKKRRSFFSNYGSYVFVTAPGENVISATPDGGYGIGKGTSFSAPMVAGLAALVRSLKYDEVQDIIAKTATSLDKENRGFRLGYGQIRVHRALHAADKALDADEKEAEEAAKDAAKAAEEAAKDAAKAAEEAAKDAAKAAEEAAKEAAQQ